LAIFRKELQEWQRLDFRILQNSPICLYHNMEVLGKDLDWLRMNDYIIHTLNAADWASESEFHESISKALDFPEFYGNNISALTDCLSEMPISNLSGGSVVLFVSFDKFAKMVPSAALNILDTFEICSRRLLLTGQRLICFIQTDDPKLAFARLGGCMAEWNPTEWSSHERAE
jgi:RNAse (barnase) inhibitor barstar